MAGPFVSVLCSNRTSQMTKTYDDIEAVTKLLEEVSTFRIIRLFRGKNVDVCSHFIIVQFVVKQTNFTLRASPECEQSSSQLPGFYQVRIRFE